MTLLFLVSVINAAAFSLLFTNSIITFGIFSLTVIFCMANLVGLMLTSWTGMIVLLVYVGGLMVMFAYFLAICPNQVILLKDMIWSFFTMLSATILVSYFCAPMLPNWPANVMPMMTMYTGQSFSLLILIAIVLFLTLIAVVKVVQLNQGPLRPFITKPRVKK